MLLSLTPLIQPSTALAQPALTTIPGRQRALLVELNLDHRLLRDVLSVSGFLLVKSLLGFGQRRPSTLTRAKALWQLITPTVAVTLVFLAVGSLGLIEDLRDDPLIAAVLIARRVGLDLRPVDRDHPNRHQPRLAAEPQHPDEQLGQRGLVAPAELRDRRVIRHLHRRDHLVRNVLPARPLDPPRGPVPTRVPVQKQRHHLGSTGRRNTVCLRL